MIKCHIPKLIIDSMVSTWDPRIEEEENKWIGAKYTLIVLKINFDDWWWGMREFKMIDWTTNKVVMNYGKKYWRKDRLEWKTVRKNQAYDSWSLFETSKRQQWEDNIHATKNGRGANETGDVSLEVFRWQLKMWKSKRSFAMRAWVMMNIQEASTWNGGIKEK